MVGRTPEYLGKKIEAREVKLAAFGVLVMSIVVLDLGLPDMDGTEVCKRIRSWNDVLIVVLAADGSEDRKVNALDGGADDSEVGDTLRYDLLAVGTARVADWCAVMRRWVRPFLAVGDVDARVTGSRVLAWKAALASALPISSGVLASRSPRADAGIGLLTCWRPAVCRGTG